VAVALLLLAPLAWAGSLATAQVVGTAAAGARTETGLDNEFKTDGRGTPDVAVSGWVAPPTWADSVSVDQVVGTATADSQPPTGLDDESYEDGPGTPDVTVSGWVVDANSWLGQGVRGPQYRGRSVASAEAGTPLVILTDDGSIVFPVQLRSPAGTHASNLKLVAYAEQRVTVGGRLIEQGQEKAMVIQYVTSDKDPADEPSAAAVETSDVEIVGRIMGLNSWLGQAESESRNAVGKSTRAGEPLVLVDGAGYVFYPVTKSSPSGPASHDLLLSYVAQDVSVKGTLIQRGRERAVIIDSLAAYVPDGQQEDVLQAGK
jgi:hypothetical protein